MVQRCVGSRMGGRGGVFSHVPDRALIFLKVFYTERSPRN